jgi:hypothetical protein
MRRRDIRVLTIAITCAFAWAGTTAWALATFTGDASVATASLSSATLAAPSGLTAQNQNCVSLTSTQVKLTWTATTSTWATGYEIFRSTTSGGPYTSRGTTSGSSTVTWVDTSVSFLTTYFYVVEASKNSWRSVNSNQASVTTPTQLCV